MGLLPNSTATIDCLIASLVLKGDSGDVGRAAGKFMPYVKKAGETPELVTALYYQALPPPPPVIFKNL
jgi:hypothetical protein